MRKRTFTMSTNRFISVSGLVLTTALLHGCVAPVTGKPSLAAEVQAAVASGRVSVKLSEGTAVLTGRVKDTSDSRAAQNAALQYEGVTRVVNRIHVTK